MPYWICCRSHKIKHDISEDQEWMDSIWTITAGSPGHHFFAMSDNTEGSLDIQLERLWIINSVPEEDEAQHSPEPEDQSALDQFKASCSRLPDGAYQVSLPRKSSPPVLGESRSLALRRFYVNERSLQNRGLMGNLTMLCQNTYLLAMPNLFLQKISVNLFLSLIIFQCIWLQRSAPPPPSIAQSLMLLLQLHLGHLSMIHC